MNRYLSCVRNFHEYKYSTRLTTYRLVSWPPFACFLFRPRLCVLVPEVVVAAVVVVDVVVAASVVVAAVVAAAAVVVAVDGDVVVAVAQTINDVNA